MTVTLTADRAPGRPRAVAATAEAPRNKCSAVMTAPGCGAAARHRPGGVPGVTNIIAVASGKGGVGKSTTAVNFALALKAQGLKVGVLDADIYGPSMPRLLGIKGQPQQLAGNKLEPMELMASRSCPWASSSTRRRR